MLFLLRLKVPSALNSLIKAGWPIRRQVPGGCWCSSQMTNQASVLQQASGGFVQLAQYITPRRNSNPDPRRNTGISHCRVIAESLHFPSRQDRCHEKEGVPLFFQSDVAGQAIEESECKRKRLAVQTDFPPPSLRDISSANHRLRIIFSAGATQPTPRFCRAKRREKEGVGREKLLVNLTNVKATTV